MKTDILLSKQSRDIKSGALQVLESHTCNIIDRLAGLKGKVPRPRELNSFLARTVKLKVLLNSNNSVQVEPFEFCIEELQLLRTALAHQRRGMAEDIQETLPILLNAPDSDALAEKLTAIDNILNSPPLNEIEPERCPRFADYLTFYGRQQIEKDPPLSEQKFDPKHKILHSAESIDADIKIYRKRCEDHRQNLAVVFADIDNFKPINKALGSEVLVDRLILPPVLNTVSTCIFGHGGAYRHGGDEFVFILPNSDLEWVSSMLSRLKKSVGGLKLPKLENPITLSAGVWITVPDSHLTANELIQYASEANAKAKSYTAKNRTVIRQEIASKYKETVIPPE
jgi:diguanylate cyclase (GGDEF)-like protein